MTTFARLLVPAVLSIAAFSANAAGAGQIPSYGEMPAMTSANPASAAGSMAADAAGFRGEESAMQPKAQARSSLTRAELRREAVAARRAEAGADPFTTGYINH